jgi:YidC/Oxa1 family membrane protein insertase
LNDVNKRARNLLLLSVLLLAAILLSGCAMPQGRVDPCENPQANAFQKLVVCPLADILERIDTVISQVKVPFIDDWSWGWTIILFTVIIKLITLPLTRKQLQSTKATQALQPKMKELQQKYGKDKQKLAEEQQKLYKEAGVNPLGGCLPLLIQLPVLWGLYQALYVLANRNHDIPAPFLWIPNLWIPSYGSSTAQPTVYEGINFQGTKWIQGTIQAQNYALLIAYFSLPLIMLVTQLLLQKMSQPRKDPKGGPQDAQGAMMNQMMMFMPVMFGYITLGLPAGLTLYWTVSNILSIVQQYFVTGWGSLADWIPALGKMESAADTKALPRVAISAEPVVSMEPSTAEKPVKRRRRRK